MLKWDFIGNSLPIHMTILNSNKIFMEVWFSSYIKVPS